MFWLSVKIKAGSMLETVVSLTILLTILALIFSSVDRLNASLNPLAVYKAHLATNRILAQENIMSEIVNEYEVDGFIIGKQMRSQGKYCTHLILEVRNSSGKLLYTRQKILDNGMDL